MSWRTALLRRLAHRLQQWGNRLLARLEAAESQPGNPPADWLARTQPAAPPAHWLERVQQLTPGQPPAELWQREERMNRRGREEHREEGREARIDFVTSVERVAEPAADRQATLPPRALRFQVREVAPAGEGKQKDVAPPLSLEPDWSKVPVAEKIAVPERQARPASRPVLAERPGYRPGVPPQEAGSEERQQAADYWPTLPDEPAADSPDGEQLWRAWQRRQRLDREQRGMAWNESPF